MTMIETVADRQVPASGGLLTPLEAPDSQTPVGCYCVAEARVGYALARQAGLRSQVVAHWADQVANAVRAGRWGGFVQEELPLGSGAVNAADMSVDALAASIL